MPPLLWIVNGVLAVLTTFFAWQLWGRWGNIFRILRDLVPLPVRIIIGKPVLKCPATHSSLSLVWTVSGNTSSVVKYILSFAKIGVSRPTDAKEQWTMVDVPEKRTEMNLEDLEPETSYKMCITAVVDDNQCYKGEVSDVMSTAAAPLPSTPVNIRTTGQVTNDQMTLTWDDEDNLGLSRPTGYSVSYTRFRQGIDSSSWEVTECETKPVVISGLMANTKYMIKVIAHSTHSSSSPGQPPNPISTLPPPPNTLSVENTSDENHLRLSWKYEQLAPIQVNNFTISYKQQDGKDTTIWKIINTKGPETSIVLPDINYGVKYYFKVVANTENGPSAPSERTPGFIPLLCPGKPLLAPNSAPTHDKILLVWDGSICPGITSFIIQYKSVDQVMWDEQPTFSQTTEFTLDHLAAETTYAVRVVAQSCSILSPPSEVGGPFTTTVYQTRDQMFKEAIRKCSQRVQKDNLGKGLELYQVRLAVARTQNRIKIMEFGSQNTTRTLGEKVILIVGATGAGKSTFINGMINFILGTDWEDSFRFRLVPESGSFDEQHKSQTQFVTIYKLHHQDGFKIPYNLTIIDTPGFGDTGGVKKDKKIIESISELFTSPDCAVDHIDAIGFVAQSTLPRLTPTQKYIFDSILSMFGKDIESNIFLLLTFCDPQLPPVLASIKEAKIPYHSSYKFNNSALFASNTSKDKEFDKLFWKMGAQGFGTFLNIMKITNEKSLKLTNEVLQEREHLEAYVTGIQEDIRFGLRKLEQYRIEADVVKAHEFEIEKCQDFTYEVKEQHSKHIELDPGEHTTNCLTCNRTCHYPCYIPKDEDKSRCAAMDPNGNCRRCDKNCCWDAHRNLPYKIVFETVVVKKTSNDLKTQYDTTCQQKITAEILLEKILDEFHDHQVEIMCMTDEVRQSLKRLNEIALRPNPLTMEDYLDILISAEKGEANPGWRDRVEQLKTVKAQAVTIRQLMDVENFNPFSSYQTLFPQVKPSTNYKEKMKKFSKLLKEKFAKHTKPKAKAFLNRSAIAYK